MSSPENHTIYINTDGGARGNPGPAGIGVVLVCDECKCHHERYIGNGTNNVAEYQAVIDALEKLPEFLKELKSKSININNIVFRLDSELVVKQINGLYKVKEPTLQEMHARIKTILNQFPHQFSFIHVPRAQNKAADLLVNHALDQALNKI